MSRWKATLCLILEGAALRLRLPGLAAWARNQARRYAPFLLALLVFLAVVTSFPAPALVARATIDVAE